jgi:hypothetical protein
MSMAEHDSAWETSMTSIISKASSCAGCVWGRVAFMADPPDVLSAGSERRETPAVAVGIGTNLLNRNRSIRNEATGPLVYAEVAA